MKYSTNKSNVLVCAQIREETTREGKRVFGACAARY